jgi:hypothetical protein
MDEKLRRDAFRLLMTGPNARHAETVYLDCLHLADGEKDPAIACGMYRILAYQFESAYEPVEQGDA